MKNCECGSRKERRTAIRYTAILAGIAWASLAWGQSTTVRAPVYIPNQIKYSDRELKPSTGRSGSVQLTVRALLDKKHKTEVEVTTGELDSTIAAPGQIKSVQFKPLTEQGLTLWTQNYTPPASVGYFNFQADGLHRGQQSQVQANVSGIDPSRTGVVTLVETVKLRPDLKAERLLAPSQATVTSPVSISLVISELNGDVGAHADCVLYADGTEIDRATGIWVDAAEPGLNCSFSHRFMTPGTVSLEARLANVIPGDFDPDNNSAKATMEILSAVPRGFTATVEEMERQSVTRSISQTWQNGAWFENYASEYAVENWFQTRVLYGYLNVPIAFPIAFLLTESADGNPLEGWSGTVPQPPARSCWWSNECQRWSLEVWDGNYRYFYVETYSQKPPVEWQFMTTVRFQGVGYALSYVSRGHCDDWAPAGCAGTSYSWNSVSGSGAGQRVPIGSFHEFQLSVLSSDGIVFDAAPAMQVFAYDGPTSSTTPFTCTTEWTVNGVTGRDCREASYYYSGDRTGGVSDLSALR